MWSGSDSFQPHSAIPTHGPERSCHSRCVSHTAAAIQLNDRGVRRMLLAAQGLLSPPAKAAKKADVLGAVRRMGALQIDTINVVARSPYLVLWSRLGSYDPQWLDQLLAEGEIFEYWSHAACFLPIEDYPVYHTVMTTGLGSHGPSFPRHRAWLERHRDVADHVLEHVRERGEVKSADFKRAESRQQGWWDWKPEKLALECLFTTGELMIARRDGFQRVYALPETVLRGREFRRVSPAEVRRALALRSVRALGVARAEWVPDYFRIKKTGIRALLEECSEAGELMRVDVAGWSQPGYLHPDNLAMAEAAAKGRLRARATTLLSPFDPIVWDRARALDLFDFHYRIEVYTKGEERRFGYFSLPILYRDVLVGRLDAKAHRKLGRFEVRALHLEDGVVATEDMTSSIRSTLQACADWHATPTVDIVKSDLPDLEDELSA